MEFLAQLDWGIWPDWANYSFPAWAVSDAAKSWLFGFIFGAGIRLIRGVFRWYKRAGTETFES